MAKVTQEYVDAINKAKEILASGKTIDQAHNESLLIKRRV